VLFLSGRKGPRADSLLPEAERYRIEQSARTADALIGVAQRRTSEQLTGVSEGPLAEVSAELTSEPAALVMLASAPLVTAQAGWLAPAVEQPPEQLGLDVDQAAIGTAEGRKIFLGGMSEAEFRARETRCLATAIYFEARGESTEGQNAVAQTIMNRVRSSIYPDTICGVVYQGADRPNSCQFSFACDGTPDVPRDKAMWEQSTDVAQRFVDGKVWLADVGYATHYHATYVQPDWVRYMKRIKRVGNHVFYRGIFVPQEDFGLGAQQTAFN
jgi:hypothetical protein